MSNDAAMAMASSISHPPLSSLLPSFEIKLDLDQFLPSDFLLFGSFTPISLPRLPMLPIKLSDAEEAEIEAEEKERDKIRQTRLQNKQNAAIQREKSKQEKKQK